MSKLHTYLVRRTLQDESRDKTKVVLPKHADVVVLGGGSIGCSTLYHLTKMGVKNSVLIEKEQLTAGTTWHTAGRSIICRQSILVKFKKYLNSIIPTIKLPGHQSETSAIESCVCHNIWTG